MQRRLILALTSSMVLFTGCDSEKPAETAAAAAASGAAAAATGAEAGEAKPEDAKPAGALGLANPANDAAVVALAKAALECEWKKRGPAYDCEAAKAWKKAEIMKKDAADPTLINFLEDEKVEVRWLGATVLGGGDWKKDKAQAGRVFAAASKEKEEMVAEKMGRLIGSINTEATGMDEDIKKLLASSEVSLLRQGIVDNVLFNNREHGGFYDLLQTMARTDKDKDVRKEAASAFWIGGGSNVPDTCKLWLELSGDPDSDIAGNSAYHAAFWSNSGGCVDQWDALLDNIEKLAKAGKVESSMMTSALGYLHGQKKATDAQKKRAMAIAATVLETEGNNRMCRSDALRVIAKSDPDQGKKLATKYKDDKDTFIKGAAKRILEPKK